MKSASRQVLVASGSNGSSQLGLDHVEDVGSYTACQFNLESLRAGTASSLTTSIPGQALSIASGAGHSLLLVENHTSSSGEDKKTSHSVWVTGSNQYGQLGDGFTYGQETPAVSAWTRLSLHDYVKAVGLPISKEHFYNPIHIACSWTSSFIGIETWTHLADGTLERGSDFVISFGTNDFGELGCGDGSVPGQPLKSNQKVHVVKLPDQSPKEDSACLQRRIRILVASQRNIVCVLDWLNPESKDPLEENIMQHVYGWGAGRQGQLDVTTAWMSGTGKVFEDQQTISGTPHQAHRQPVSRATQKAQTRPRPASKRSNQATGDLKLKASRFPSIHSCPVQIDLFKAVADSELETRVEQVAVGSSHIVFKIKHGTETKLIGLGSNAKSQLQFTGLPASNLSSSCKIDTTWNGTFVAPSRQAQSILSTGSNTHGQLGIGAWEDSTEPTNEATRKPPFLVPISDMQNNSTSRHIADLVCGSEHVILVTDDIETAKSLQQVWTWGWNEHGNLGLGEDKIEDRWTPAQLDMTTLHTHGTIKIEKVWAGCATSWLLLQVTDTDAW